MSSQKITLTIPQSLHQEVKRLVRAGYYANFAELARAGIRKEIIVPSTVLDEATKNLSYIHSILVTKFNDLIYGYEKFSVVSDEGLPLLT